MAPRANWKGFLRLSLVTCPIASVSGDSGIREDQFNQINKQTGNRIRYLKVDADTGDRSRLRTSSRATRSTQTGILK